MSAKLGRPGEPSEQTAPGTVLVALTDEQLERVMTRATGGQGPVAALVQSMAASGRGAAELLANTGTAYSTSLVRGVMLLQALPPDGSAIALKELARLVGAPTSTTHRYLKTWMALGMVEQEPSSRRYRRASGNAAG